MLNTTKNLPVDDPGEEFWRQLPQKVLEEVRQYKKKAAADAVNNVVNLVGQRQKSARDPHGIAAHYPESKSISPSKAATHQSNHYNDFTRHKLSAVAAIAAVLLLVFNVLLLSPKSGYLWFDQASYQARIDLGKALPQLAQTLALPGTANTRFETLGFVQDRTERTYSVGIMLAAAFAQLQSGNFQSALQQLHALQKQVQQPTRNHQVSAVTMSSIRKATELLQAEDITSNRVKQQQVSELLTQFQGDYEKYIANNVQSRQLVLFRSGIWVFNAALAVAAQDRVALRWMGFASQLDYLQKGFARLNAPAGVRKSLQEIAAIIARQSAESDSLSDKDFSNLQQALQNLNTLLS